MIPGPVFAVELLTTSRRARYYVLRAVYGTILLAILWQNYQAAFWWTLRQGDEVSISQLASFAESVFWSFVVAQGIAVVLLTPVLVAGTIADEKGRRTLHDLITSPLSSAEIVLGKLLARLLHLGVFLAVGLPIFSLLTLIGGVPPLQVFLAFGASATTGFFLAGLAILVSTYARDMRESLRIVFLLELAWLIIPPVLAGPLSEWPRIYATVDPVNDWFFTTSPFALLPGSGVFRPGTPLGVAVAWMAGLQVAAGLGFVGISVWRLRPVYRAQLGGVGWFQWRRNPPGNRPRGRRAPWLPEWLRRWTRPPVGNDSMLWKELHTVRSRGALRWVVRALFVLGVLWLAWFAIPLGIDSTREFWGAGGRRDTSILQPRSVFNVFLRSVGTLLYVIWGLVVAIAASTSVTTEKEGDTWVSLVTTPLEPGDILQAKMLGAVWGVRAVGVVLGGLWLFGLIAGALHPIGLLFVAIEVAVFTWFAMALGVTFSLRARNSTRAVVATVAVLFVLNGGYLLCCIPMDPDTALVGLGCTPMIVMMSQLSYDDFWGMLGHSTNSYYSGEWIAEMVVTCLLGTLAYLAAALVLTGAAASTFDELVDRPRRSSPGSATTPPPRPPKPAHDNDLEIVEE